MSLFSHLRDVVILSSVACCICTNFAMAEMMAIADDSDVIITEERISVSHGVAIHGTPKYGADFTHFDYVNPNAPKGGEMRLSTIGTFNNLNPFILKGVPAQGVNLTFETLLEGSEDEAFSQYGLLAETMEIPTDRSWVVFNLRPEAKFHDGKPVTAEDVAFTFSMLTTKGHPFYRAYYADVKEVIVEDTYRVRFVFNISNNMELPLIVGQLPVLPKHFFKDKDFSKTTLTPIMGSGAYKISKVDTGRKIEYERVPNWWGRDLAVNKGRYNFDKISYDYYRDSSVELQALFAGEYDFRQEAIAKSWKTGYDVEDVKTGGIVKLEQKHERPQGMQAFVFNTRRDIFTDMNVRKAIGMAFDFEWSNKQFAFSTYKRTKSFFSNSELASSGIPTGRELEILEQFKDKLPANLFTQPHYIIETDGTGHGIRKYLRKGSKLLNKAGWRLGADGIRQKNGHRLSFEILSKSPSFERWVNPFIQNLKKMGVDAHFRVVDTAQYQNRMDNFNFDMTIGSFGQSLSPGNEQRDFWHSNKVDVKGARNTAGVKSPVVDALIDMIIVSPSREELIYRTRALDRVLLWGEYMIPQWHIDYFRLAYRNKFDKPEISPKYGMGAIDTWWTKADK